MAERLERHPLSAIWGDMPNDQYRELVDSIRESGDLMAEVRTLDGMVLDGWHRYRAALDAEVQPLIVPWSGDDPAGYVIRQNAHRRHLTAGQRAICVAKIYEWVVIGSNQYAQKEGVTTRYTLDGDEEGFDDTNADQRPGEVRDQDGVEEMGSERGSESFIPPGDVQRNPMAAGTGMEQGRAEGTTAEGLATGSGEAITTRLIGEKAQTTRKTAGEAKAIIRAGLAEAVLNHEMSFEAALREARGEPDAPKPTKLQRLEAERDGLALDVQDKATRIDELEDELQFHRGNMNEQEHERHKAFTAVRAELSTALSQNNEWMTKANDEVQARKGMTYDRDRWRERAMHPCANCGTEAEWADG